MPILKHPQEIEQCDVYGATLNFGVSHPSFRGTRKLAIGY